MINEYYRMILAENLLYQIKTLCNDLLSVPSIDEFDSGIDYAMKRILLLIGDWKGGKNDD